LKKFLIINLQNRILKGKRI